jgi:hypothetical protein
MVVVVVVRSLLDLSLSFRNNVSQSNVVFNVLLFILASKAHFQSVVCLTLEHHRTNVITWGQMGVDNSSTSAGTCAALATNVHGVAQVSAGRAVADVIIGILLGCVMVVVGQGV